MFFCYNIITSQAYLYRGQASTNFFWHKFLSENLFRNITQKYSFEKYKLTNMTESQKPSKSVLYEKKLKPKYRPIPVQFRHSLVTKECWETQANWCQSEKHVLLKFINCLTNVYYKQAQWQWVYEQYFPQACGFMAQSTESFYIKSTSRLKLDLSDLHVFFLWL